MGSENENSAAGNHRVDECTDRRKALICVRKFAAYVAPFTILTLTNKAEAASGHGPGEH